MPDSNPISGPYSAPVASYHQATVSKYNRTILVTAPFIATGSYANPSALYLSGSTVSVTLTGGGQITLPMAQNQHPSMIHDISVYSVDAGSVYLLYR